MSESAEAQAILSRAAAVEAQRQSARARGDTNGEIAALLELETLHRAYVAARDDQRADRIMIA